MINKQNLAEMVQGATKAMTPAELMRFRRELARELPIVIDKAADQARQENKQKRGKSDEKEKD